MARAPRSWNPFGRRRPGSTPVTRRQVKKPLTSQQQRTRRVLAYTGAAAGAALLVALGVVAYKQIRRPGGAGKHTGNGTSQYSTPGTLERPTSRPGDTPQTQPANGGRRPVNGTQTTSRPSSRPSERSTNWQPYRPVSRQGHFFLTPEESALGISQQIKQSFGKEIEDMGYNFSKPAWKYSSKDTRGYESHLRTKGAVIELERIDEFGQRHQTYVLVDKNGSLIYPYPKINGKFVRDPEGKTGLTGDLVPIFEKSWGSYVKQVHLPKNE